MKNKFIWLGLSFLLVASMLLVSCTTKTTSSTSTTTKTTTATTTTVTGNWWDSLGTPQYGGIMNLRINADIASFDSYAGSGKNVTQGWQERLFTDNWLVPPTVFPFQSDYHPADMAQGELAKSWEFTDPNTFVVTIRQDVHWQNIPPANGRPFVASDVVWNYDHEFGLGGGYTKMSPYSNTTAFNDCKSVTATDNYTVVFKWDLANPEFIGEAMFGPVFSFQNPEAVQQWGDLKDWHHAVGTGPFMLSDNISGTSVTLVKNPNYYAHDERHPQNQLPYVDKAIFFVIPDSATALSALRSGKLDYVDGITVSDSQSIKKTNPEIVQFTCPLQNTTTIDPRNDKAPFNDIRVRQAMQMAINLPDIAANYYAGQADPWPSSLTSNYLAGWGIPYLQWPQDLKDQYAYNPTQAKALLAAAGYASGFNTDIVADNAGDLTLLQLVKSYFAAVNINMTINQILDSSFVPQVMGAHSQDALAQWVNGTYGLSYEPLIQLQRLHTGSFTNFLMVSDPTLDAFLTTANAATTLDDVKTAVKNANLYIAQQHFAISLIDAPQFCFCQPWLKGYAQQASSLGGSGGGPQYFGHYAARFWIDSNLKTSLGH